MYERIVVGTDFSDTAALAVRNAVELATEFDAELHVLTAFKPALTVNVAASSLEAMAHGGATIIADAESRIGEEVSERLGHLSDKIVRDKGIRVTVQGLPGDPADAILSYAEKLRADLIVVGNRGMGGVKRFVLGSVPNKITHHSPCSVLVVHTTD